MRKAQLIALLVLLSVLVAASDLNPAYFSNVREVRIAHPEGQNYLVVDTELWDKGSTSLGDLRLVTSAGSEIPYAMVVKAGSSSTREIEVKVLQLGTVKGATDFVLDVSAVPEYDQVRLRLGAMDFIAHAKVEGRDDLAKPPVTLLGTYTLYDFTREFLGSNSTLKLPRSRFRYLHIHIDGAVKPEDVLGASVANIEEQEAQWTPLDVNLKIEQAGKSTLLVWDAIADVPVDRVVLLVDPADVNFRRDVQVLAHNDMVGRGEIHRIRMKRDGREVDSEDLALSLGGIHSPRYKLTIENGDDPPLHVLGVQVFSIERRVYFDPRGNSTLRLYYGDDRLTAPTYDYAKLFQEPEGAPRAELGPGTHNSAYTGRPDERPWTDKHPAVLWTAMILAVAGLAGVALRGLKS
ncbi:MAG: DUF3999 family protein [Acidobacteriota bacterium]|nr:DUF3999 family protein [Acidobacteriota bacterium]